MRSTTFGILVSWALAASPTLSQERYVADTTRRADSLLIGTWLQADTMSLTAGPGGMLVPVPASSTAAFQFQNNGTFTYTASFSSGQIEIYEAGSFRIQGSSVTLNPTRKTYRRGSVSEPDVLRVRTYSWRTEIDTIRNKRSLVLTIGSSTSRYDEDAPLPASARPAPTPEPRAPDARTCEVILMNQPLSCQLPPGVPIGSGCYCNSPSGFPIQAIGVAR